MKDYSVLLTCGEANMVIIHDAFDKGYQQGYEDGKKSSCDCKDSMEAEYNRGLNDAWEVIQKITSDDIEGGYSYEMMQEIFGVRHVYDIVPKYTPQDAIRIIKEYEKQQKQFAIQVGDEVYSEDLDWTFIVTKIITSKYMDNTVKRYEGICTDGACYDNLPKDIVKTGRRFDQIVKVLAEMRGESE